MRIRTVQHERMALLMRWHGKPAADYLEKGGDRLKLRHALARRWVDLRKK
jgi:hypothetical protein